MWQNRHRLFLTYHNDNLRYNCICSIFFVCVAYIQKEEMYCNAFQLCVEFCKNVGIGIGDKQWKTWYRPKKLIGQASGKATVFSHFNA